MKCIKFSVLLAITIAAVPSESHHIFQKFHHNNEVVEVPVHVKPVHVQPVIFQEPEIQHVPVHVEEAPAKKPWHIHSMFQHIKDSASNHKIFQIFHKKASPVPVVEAPVHVPELNVWPSLGFSHYKKVHYIPVYPVHEESSSHAPIERVHAGIQKEVIQHEAAHDHSSGEADSPYPPANYIPYPPIPPTLEGAHSSA